MLAILLGYGLQMTEPYIDCKQHLRIAVNDRLASNQGESALSSNGRVADPSGTTQDFRTPSHMPRTHAEFGSGRHPDAVRNTLFQMNPSRKSAPHRIQILHQAALASVEVGRGKIAGQFDLSLDGPGFAFDGGVFAHELDLGLNAAEVAVVLA